MRRAAVATLLLALVAGCGDDGGGGSPTLRVSAAASLKEAVTNAKVAGWCDVSAVALFKRLCAAEHWLRWMAEQL